MHPVYILAFVTFLVVLAFAGWVLLSARRNRLSRGQATGLGGPSDPLAGENRAVRHPDALRGSLGASPEPTERHPAERRPN